MTSKSKLSLPPTKILWIDCETSGLESHHQILEIAIIMTGKGLIPLKQIHYVVKPDLNVTFSEFAAQCHKTPYNGTSLWDECQRSVYTISQIDQLIYETLKEWAPLSSKFTPAGCSIHTDLKFIQKYMPLLFSRLHYRVLDVSSIYQCVMMWSKSVSQNQPKNCQKHRALTDIQNTIKLFDFYKKFIFQNDHLKPLISNSSFQKNHLVSIN